MENFNVGIICGKIISQLMYTKLKLFSIYIFNVLLKMELVVFLIISEFIVFFLHLQILVQQKFG